MDFVLVGSIFGFLATIFILVSENWKIRHESLVRLVIHCVIILVAIFCVLFSASRLLSLMNVGIIIAQICMIAFESNNGSFGG